MAEKDSKENLLLRKHELERENLAARREIASRSGLFGPIAMPFGFDPLDLEEAQLKERHSRELLALIEEEIGKAKPTEPNTSPEMKRFGSMVMSRSAVNKMEAYLESKGIGLTDFASSAGTTDRTLRRFRKTGRVRRDILRGVAQAMGLEIDDLLD
jgi:DNA-binding Xre family transcriptional regulator